MNQLSSLLQTPSLLFGKARELRLKAYDSGFIKSALALSDDYEKGLLDNLSAYDLQCKIVAEKIASKNITGLKDLVGIDDIPVVLKSALNALLNGIYFRNNGI